MTSSRSNGVAEMTRLAPLTLRWRPSVGHREPHSSNLVAVCPMAAAMSRIGPDGSEYPPVLTGHGALR